MYINYVKKKTKTTNPKDMALLAEQLLFISSDAYTQEANQQMSYNQWMGVCPLCIDILGLMLG